jgi:hypothetical protein
VNAATDLHRLEEKVDALVAALASRPEGERSV